MSPKQNKYVNAAVEQVLKADLTAGAFPEVQYRPASGNGFTGDAFMLMEYLAVRNLYLRCVDRELVKRGYPMGIFETLRSAAWVKVVTEVVGAMHVIHADALKDGQNVNCKGLYNHGPREGVITEAHEAGADTPYIVGCVHFARTNGHEDDAGSCYVWEVEAVETEQGWRPFDITEQERQWQKEADELPQSI